MNHYNVILYCPTETPRHWTFCTKTLDKSPSKRYRLGVKYLVTADELKAIHLSLDDEDQNKDYVSCTILCTVL